MPGGKKVIHSGCFYIEKFINRLAVACGATLVLFLDPHPAFGLVPLEEGTVLLKRFCHRQTKFAGRREKQPIYELL